MLLVFRPLNRNNPFNRLMRVLLLLEVGLLISWMRLLLLRSRLLVQLLGWQLVLLLLLLLLHRDLLAYGNVGWWRPSDALQTGSAGLFALLLLEGREHGRFGQTRWLGRRWIIKVDSLWCTILGNSLMKRHHYHWCFFVSHLTTKSQKKQISKMCPHTSRILCHDTAISRKILVQYTKHTIVGEKFVSNTKDNSEQTTTQLGL